MPPVRRKRVLKAATASETEKYHWMRRGFNAFGAQLPKESKKRGQTLARCAETEPSETGIHSLAWAIAIVPQSCGLLRLPFEVRHKIWNLVLENLSYGDEPITPMKKGNIFYSANWPRSSNETVALSEICRQIYVDIVGGGLLYKAKQFSFTPSLMLNYLWVINPDHKNSIRSIQLNIKVSYRVFRTPAKAFRMLAKLPNLQHLHLKFIIDNGLGSIPRYTIFTPRLLSIRSRSRSHLISESIITTIRTCSALREIKGLQSLEMDFLTYDREYMNLWDHQGYVKYENIPVLLSEGSSGPYYDLKEEMQRVMIAQK